jgi:hypothetical protein
MKSVNFRLLLIMVMVVLIWLTNPLNASAEEISEDVVRAIGSIENINSMRNELARSLENTTEPPTMETFKEVCRPVGMRLKEVGAENGWQVKQIAKKYRNPNHAPQTLHETMAIAKFEQNPDLIGFWEQETLNNEQGIHYYRRINVSQSCLACHGAKNTRPNFIAEKYPEDLAFDFQEGDLRGMYSVFIPELKKFQN